MTSPNDHTKFRTKASFMFFYSLPLFVAVAVAVDMVINPRPNKWLGLVLVLVVAALSVPPGWAKVVLDGDQLTLLVPLRKPQVMELRQLVDFETSTRVWNRFILRYHPVDEQGRVARDVEAFLGLPPVEDQMMLEERLRESLAQLSGQRLGLRKE